MASTVPTETETSSMLARASIVLAASGLMLHLAWVIGAGHQRGIPGFVFIALELWSVASAVGFLWLTWPRQPSEPEPDEKPGTVTAVVTCGAGDAEAVRTTLIGLRLLEAPVQAVLVDPRNRPEIRALAHEFRAIYHARPSDTLSDSFMSALSDLSHGVAIWLDAGQTPKRGLVREVTTRFVDHDVAVVQFSRSLLNADSYLAMERSGDIEAVEDQIISPNLAAIGLAPWLGPGSAVRVDALHSIGGLERGDASAIPAAASRLQAAGWRTLHADVAVVADHAPDTLDEYLGYRRRRSLAVLKMTLGPSGPFRLRGQTIRARFVQLATVLLYGNGVRQAVYVLLLAAVLLTGRLPVHASIPELTMFWGIPTVFAAFVRACRVDGRLRPGDATRNAWRNLSAEMSAMWGLTGARFRSRRPGSGFGALSRMGVATMSLVIIDACLVLRGLTVVSPDLLPRMSTTARVFMIVAAIGAMVPLVDVLQMSVRRKQRRQTVRVPAALNVFIGDEPARSVDLTTRGIAVEFGPLNPGSHRRLHVGFETLAGEQFIEIPAVVRHCRPTADGYVTGFEFVQVSNQAQSALIGYCMYGDTAGAIEVEHRVDALDQLEPSMGRRSVRVLSVLACCAGAIAIFLGPGASTSFAAGALGQGSVCVANSQATPVAGATVAYHNAGWQTFGTTAEDGCVHGEIPLRANAAFRATHEGITAQLRHDTTTDPVVRFSTIPTTVTLTTSTGDPIPNATVDYHNGSWTPFGTTNQDGTTTKELLPNNIATRIRHNGLTARAPRQQTSTNPTIAYQTGSVQADDGADVVSYHAGGWQDFEDGIELLAGRVQFRLADNTRVRLNVVAAKSLSVPSGTIVEPGGSAPEPAATTTVATAATSTSSSTTAPPATTTTVSAESSSTTSTSDSSTTTAPSQTTTTLAPSSVSSIAASTTLPEQTSTTSTLLPSTTVEQAPPETTVLPPTTLEPVGTTSLFDDELDEQLTPPAPVVIGAPVTAAVVAAPEPAIEADEPIGPSVLGISVVNPTADDFEEIVVEYDVGPGSNIVSAGAEGWSCAIAGPKLSCVATETVAAGSEALLEVVTEPVLAATPSTDDRSLILLVGVIAILTLAGHTALSRMHRNRVRLLVATAREQAAS